MNTSIITPKELFQKQVCYTIPTFQRPYVWTHEDQWEPLWEDVRILAENYLEKLGGSGDSVKAEQETKHHFLGAVVLQQVPTAVRDIEQREVIDGQQRVTTLQLLLDAIQQVCEEKSFKLPATRLSKLVTNDEDLIGEGSHHIFKLWPTRIDREAFRHAMDNGLAVNDFEDSRIVQAHDFFQQQVRKWLENPVDSEEQSIEALETAVTALLQLVVIGLDFDEDPNVIFETLNARGTPLEQSDLIKNYVLSQHPAARDSGGDLWEDLDNQWWRDEVRQGRLYRPRLDMLFNHWLAMRSGEEVSHSNVFNAFQNCASDKYDGHVDVLMSEVKQDLNNYRRFDLGVRTPEEDLFYYRLNVMQAGVVTPVLLVLLAAEHEPRIRAFQALESFLVRRMICRKTTKDYNRLILELAVRLRNNGPEKADKVVIDFLRGQEADSREWPKDVEMAHELGTSQVYRLLTRGRLRLVLEGIEGRLRSTKAEQPEVPKGLTIEHLMPVSWGENWPLPSYSDPEASRNRNRTVHTIGNLTLVNQKLNSSLSNGPWQTKREGLMQHSVLTLNSELRNRPHWDEEAILGRSQRMAKLIAECWPGPDSSNWG